MNKYLLLQFIRIVRTRHSSISQTPILVHCRLLWSFFFNFLVHCDENSICAENWCKWNLSFQSAGIGRTGTFIALDRLLQELYSGARSVSVFYTVKEMRKHRPKLVQTAEQYMFIYLCLQQAIRQYTAIGMILLFWYIPLLFHALVIYLLFHHFT